MKWHVFFIEFNFVESARKIISWTAFQKKKTAVTTTMNYNAHHTWQRHHMSAVINH